jgi:hypothetical protein
MNVPTEVKLDADGNPGEQNGQYGMEWRYMLDQRRIMWVPPEVHAAIQRAQGGDWATYAITKHKAPEPWTVVHITDEPAAQWQAPDQHPAPRPQPPAAPRPRQEASAGQPQQGATPSEQPYSTHMHTALCAAIRVATAAEDFAKQQLGRAIAFETADIRALAATLFIHATGGGR